MTRIDDQKFCKIDYIVNFGVQPKVKTEMTEII